jgi:hypothetical protein
MLQKVNAIGMCVHTRLKDPGKGLVLALLSGESEDIFHVFGHLGLMEGVCVQVTPKTHEVKLDKTDFVLAEGWDAHLHGIIHSGVTKVPDNAAKLTVPNHW